MAQPLLLKLLVEKTNPNCSSRGKTSRIRHEETNPTLTVAPGRGFADEQTNPNRGEPAPPGVSVRRTNEPKLVALYGGRGRVVGEKKIEAAPAASQARLQFIGRAQEIGAGKGRRSM